MASVEDRISGLPDELLRAILFRVRSARDAVRTSVLSRRWRHILDRPPPDLELSLGNSDAAPVLKRLQIVCHTAGASQLPTARFEPWLRFAAERVLGELIVYLPELRVDGEEAVLKLPLCEWVQKIQLGMGTINSTWRIRLPSAGLFRALANLSIFFGRMDGNELTALVCTQCPVLRILEFTFVILVDALDISIRSDSLQSLSFGVKETRRLEIVAPGLEKLSVYFAIDEVRIIAPKLQELLWLSEYDSSCHQFDDVGRRLRMLMLESGTNLSLIQQFDEVDELRLYFSIPQEIAGYESFLNETNRLPKCKLLDIYFKDQHALVPGMLHLLRSCNSTRKVFLMVAPGDLLEHPCLPSCPCLLEESYRIDGISLNSLEEVEITSFASSHEVLDFVEQLPRCNASNLRKVVIKHMLKSTPPTKEVRDKIRSMCQPNIEVEFYVFFDQELVPLD